jgi:hypothetical protein
MELIPMCAVYYLVFSGGNTIELQLWECWGLPFRMWCILLVIRELSIVVTNIQTSRIHPKCGIPWSGINSGPAHVQFVGRPFPPPALGVHCVTILTLCVKMAYLGIWYHNSLTTRDSENSLDRFLSGPKGPSDLRGGTFTTSSMPITECVSSNSHTEWAITLTVVMKPIWLWKNQSVHRGCLCAGAKQFREEMKSWAVNVESRIINPLKSSQDYTILDASSDVAGLLT